MLENSENAGLSLVRLSAFVGAPVVFQKTPHSVITSLPLSMICPPKTTVDSVISEISVVKIVGRYFVLLSFLIQRIFSALLRYYIERPCSIEKKSTFFK